MCRKLFSVSTIIYNCYLYVTRAKENVVFVKVLPTPVSSFLGKNL